MWSIEQRLGANPLSLIPASKAFRILCCTKYSTNVSMSSSLLAKMLYCICLGLEVEIFVLFPLVTVHISAEPGIILKLSSLGKRCREFSAIVTRSIPVVLKYNSSICLGMILLLLPLQQPLLPSTLVLSYFHSDG